MSGFVYAIECGGRIKIGHSEKPESRFSKIASDAPFPCVLHGYWLGTVADELDVHTKFNDIRVHGEWFAATENLLQFIADHVAPRTTKPRKFSILPSDLPLAVWRKSQGKPMQHFADIAGVSKMTWHRWETGSTTMPAAQMARLRKITGLSVEDLAPKVFGVLEASGEFA